MDEEEKTEGGRAFEGENRYYVRPWSFYRHNNRAHTLPLSGTP
jgi:hypothetical protein